MKVRKARKKMKRHPVTTPAKRRPYRIVVLGALLLLAPIAAAPMFFSGPGTYTVETRAGRTVVQKEPGAAISISPNAVGSTVDGVRVTGFKRALVDNGRGSHIKNFEAVR